MNKYYCIKCHVWIVACDEMENCTHCGTKLIELPNETEVRE